MAVFTGTASSHFDLLNKIVGHLTDAGAMGSQVWQLLLSRTSGTGGAVEERYLKGPGLAGADNIHVNLYGYSNAGADYFNIGAAGAVAFNALLPFGTQPGKSPDTQLLLWNSNIPYWLIANGRRFIIIAKISTVFVCGYYGFYLPYATSSEMPYPFYAGGTSSLPRRWSSTRYDIGSFYDPTRDSCYLRHFDGQWLNIYNYDNEYDYRNAKDLQSVWPWMYDMAWGNNQNGEFTLFPAILNANYSGGNVYGELQGVFCVSGFGNAAENTITVAGKTYLVVQSMQRTTRRDYAAILLE